VLLGSGRTDRPIRGPVLDGNGVGAVHDTDNGRWDGDATWDRALGPMQFIPSTWRKWAADGNADGVADPDQIDDAALAAARYLCASGRMGTPRGWLDAVYAYNHSSSYVQKVADTANLYAAQAS
jgi:membrane-bound lytic murein transglycosylase B